MSRDNVTATDVFPVKVATFTQFRFEQQRCRPTELPLTVMVETQQETKHHSEIYF